MSNTDNKIVTMIPTITIDYFKKTTGRLPVDDDLLRVNCSKRGTGHNSCGWCVNCDKPYFQCGGIHK